jgi:hypothetical protein
MLGIMWLEEFFALCESVVELQRHALMILEDA